MMNEDIQKQWRNLLDPNLLRDNLKAASLYITAFEILKESIISRLRNFFSRWSTDEGFKPTQDYQSHVLSRNRSPLYASLAWLEEMGAISPNDLIDFEQIKHLRNELAHQMTHYLSEGIDEAFFETFSLMFNFLDKVDTWWIINFEVPTNSDYDGETIEEKDVFSGQVLLLQMMLEVALGSREDASKYLDTFNQENDK
jgi:hypothetical protein